MIPMVSGGFNLMKLERREIQTSRVSQFNRIESTGPISCIEKCKAETTRECNMVEWDDSSQMCVLGYARNIVPSKCSQDTSSSNTNVYAVPGTELPGKIVPLNEVQIFQIFY